MAQPNKKSFEFRMSKKVAELTQVVHMLFTRNHEKEVEIDALKDAYEYEIELVIKDAKSRLEKADKRIRDLEKQQAEGNNKLKAQVEQSLASREEEWKVKCGQLERLLETEKRETQNARDLLVKAQQDIERLKRNHESELRKASREITDKAKEIDRLKDIIRSLENSINEKHKQLSSANDMNKQNDTLRRDIDKLKEHLRGAEKAKEQSQVKSKQLENDIRTLRREMNKKRSDTMPPNIHPGKMEREATQSGDYDEEVERLRREIQRYRMELSNRETNFNRMFAEKSPMHTEGGRSNRSSTKQAMMQQAFENGVIMRIARERTGQSMAGFDLQRERTLPVSSTSQTRVVTDEQENKSDAYDFQSATTPRSVSAALQQQQQQHNPPASPSGPNHRLPQLTHSSDSKNRLQKLMKPKPLPREMLSTRAGGH